MYDIPRNAQEDQLAHLKHAELPHAFQYYISLVLHNLSKQVALKKCQVAGFHGSSKNILSIKSKGSTKPTDFLYKLNSVL